MTIPAAEFIEMAIDSVKSKDTLFIEKELKEFEQAGGKDSDKQGYLIGLETARIMNSMTIGKMDL